MKTGMSARFVVLWLVLLLSLVGNRASWAQLPPDSGLGRCINFGNMLEAPNEGDWGLTAEPLFFLRTAEAGFDTIRLPVSWTWHASHTPPYTIDPVFFRRIDQVIAQARALNLNIIINNHHYDELNDDPVSESPRALAIWRQISRRYRNMPDSVSFEVLNEPHGVFNDFPALWNVHVQDAVNVIRQSNLHRKIIVGPVGWNSIAELSSFVPPDDPNLIATVHYYAPFEFTHQGAEWIVPTPPTGKLWIAKEFIMGDNWQNWSWQTQVTPATEGLKIRYESGWAGFQLHHGQGLPRPDRLVLTVDRPLLLKVNVHATDGSDYGFIVQTTGNEPYNVVDFSTLPANLVVSEIFLQNYSPDPQPEFVLSRLYTRKGRDLEWMILTSQQAIANSMRTAAQWAAAHSVPMLLGEFGACSAGDCDSRVAWTRAVRTYAERNQLAWAYWELAAGFGIYSPVEGTWKVELREALLGR